VQCTKGPMPSHHGLANTTVPVVYFSRLRTMLWFYICVLCAPSAKMNGSDYGLVVTSIPPLHILHIEGHLCLPRSVSTFNAPAARPGWRIHTYGRLSRCSTR
jgi:hypothetical protein